MPKYRWSNNVSDTPNWAYHDDNYCVCCGNGDWKDHMPECQLRDALDLLAAHLTEMES